MIRTDRMDCLRCLAVLAAAALAAGCGGGLPTLGSGSSPMATASLMTPEDPGWTGPEVVHLPRYAITGQPYAPSRGVKTDAPTARAQEQFDVVTLFFATNRKEGKTPPASRSQSKSVPQPSFTGDRAKHLTLGLAQVTIPNANRATGSIRRPRQIAVLSIDISREAEDPRKHFTMGNLQVLDASRFYAMASLEGTRPREFKDHAMVFVHGYNTSFEDAIFRTAQLAHDIGFDGVPYAFSWPSKADPLAYPYDRDSADASQGHLAEFLDLIAKRTTAKKIHIVAHSVGARLVVDALYPAKAPSSVARNAKIGEIILAAADIDRSVLESRADSIKAAGKPVTMYVTANDYALAASKKFSGGIPRAGDANDGQPIVLPGVETIDISDGGGGLFSGASHTTFAEKAHVLTDMALLMRGAVHPPNRRFPVFAPIKTADGSDVSGGSAAGGTYWRYVRNDGN
jgi:esterase/lipase superfamily enzyme